MWEVLPMWITHMTCVVRVELDYAGCGAGVPPPWVGGSTRWILDAAALEQVPTYRM